MTVGRPRVVILGGGLVGLSAARALARVALDVTLIDRRNYQRVSPAGLPHARARERVVPISELVFGTLTQNRSSASQSPIRKPSNAR